MAQFLDMVNADGRTPLTVKRGHSWDDAYQELHQRTPESLKARMRVQFINEHDEVEAGVDGGGLFKEFIESVMQVCLSCAWLCISMDFKLLVQL
jgi:hypothetical protein